PAPGRGGRHLPRAVRRPVGEAAPGLPAARGRGALLPGGGRDRRLPGVDGAQPPVQRPQAPAPRADPALPGVRRGLGAPRGGAVTGPCPDWRGLAAPRFDSPGAATGEPAGWAEALAHLDGCPACRRAALEADPTLLFRRLPALPPPVLDLAP